MKDLINILLQDNNFITLIVYLLFIVFFSWMLHKKDKDDDQNSTDSEKRSDPWTLTGKEF